jgi:hypothetical protein
MFRPTSLTIRATRALVALITVWCLGCSGFEPLVDALFDRVAGSGMTCGPGGADAGETGGMAATDSPLTPGITSVLAQADDHRSFDCGCGQSCHGVSPMVWRDTTRPAPLPQVASADASQPPNVVRAPLLPPPERTA